MLPGSSITGSRLPGLPTLLIVGLPITLGGAGDPGLRMPLPGPQYTLGGVDGGGLGSSGMGGVADGLPCPATGLCGGAPDIKVARLFIGETGVAWEEPGATKPMSVRMKVASRRSLARRAR